MKPIRPAPPMWDLSDSQLGLPDCVSPAIRSSDYRTVRSDPFLYLIRRRLGLVPWTDYSGALNRGAWFHRVFAHGGSLPDEHVIERLVEVRDRCEERRVDPQKFVEREEQDMRAATSWYLAAARVGIGPNRQTFPELLGEQDGWRVVGREVAIGRPGSPPTVIQLDQLLIDTKTGRRCRILDVKTTSLPPQRRLSTVDREFQTLLYLREAQRNWDRIRRHFRLPRAAVLEGMFHLAVQKPLLRPCGKDIGADGEIDWTHYLARCAEWYLCEGPYADKAGDEPRVNVSYTPLWVARAHDLLFATKLAEVRRYSRMRPLLHLFPPNDEVAQREATYEKFYQLAPDEWGGIIEHDGFVVQRREADLPAPPFVQEIDR